MGLILAVAHRLPTPVQDRLRTVKWTVEAVGVPRLCWWRKLRTLRRYGVTFRRQPALAAKYLLLDPELDNFTYELGNELELVGFLADALGVSRETIEAFFKETREDPELNERVRERLRRRLDRKRTPLFGRRLGWYAIARALKPAVIVETGIHDGLGSLLLLHALERNAQEGSPGRLISVDINPRAGWLVPEELRGRWSPVYGSTFDVLEDAVRDLKVGMIVHDSEHTYECEHFELTTAVAHAAPTLALLSDNAHATTALRDVCASLAIEYRFFRERPAGHFYPGAGIGLGILEQRAAAAGREQASQPANARSAATTRSTSPSSSSG